MLCEDGVWQRSAVACPASAQRCPGSSPSAPAAEITAGRHSATEKKTKKLINKKFDCLWKNKMLLNLIPTLMSDRRARTLRASSLACSSPYPHGGRIFPAWSPNALTTVVSWASWSSTSGSTGLHSAVRIKACTHTWAKKKEMQIKGIIHEDLRSSLIRWHGWTHLQRFQQQSWGEEGWESWYQPHEDYRSGQEAAIQSDNGQAGSKQHSHQGVDHTHCPGREQTAGLSSGNTWDSAWGISDIQHTSSPHEI